MGTTVTERADSCGALTNYCSIPEENEDLGVLTPVSE